MTAILRNRIPDWRDERGVTMLLSLFVLVLTTLLLGATYVAVTNDTTFTRNQLDQQRAYAAAQAGIAQYTYQLNQNVNYWELCAPPPPAAVPTSTDGGSTEYYSITPLIASTAPSNDQTCDTANPVNTMIEAAGTSSGANNPAAGTFRISSTGWSGPTGTSTLSACTPAAHCVSRTIVVQYKRQSFLNYVYYTDYETLDPVALYNPSNTPSEPTDCAVHYNGRGNDCSGPIVFVSGDAINGPLHSEDTLAVCGSGGSGPTFGRAGKNDAVEAAGPAVAPAGASTEGQNGCSLTYTVNNTAGAINTSAASLTPPPTNAQILTIAQTGGLTYTGSTTIVLNGTTMSVTNNGTTVTSQAWPTNGVIYVSTASSGCPVTYTPYTANAAYAGDTNCGNVYVSGTYSKSLTIASDNDIIINGSLTTPSLNTNLLGLVANDFVRIYHPVSNRTGTSGGQCGGGASNGTGSLTSPTIDAAILAVNHSFIVDNYDCGSSLGTLTINGAIAQLFRGPVGTGGGGGNSTGYLKSYTYNDTLAAVEPPYFLNPVSAAWYVQRQTECNGSSC